MIKKLVYALLMVLFLASCITVVEPTTKPPLNTKVAPQGGQTISNKPQAVLAMEAKGYRFSWDASIQMWNAFDTDEGWMASYNPVDNLWGFLVDLPIAEKYDDYDTAAIVNVDWEQANGMYDSSWLEGLGDEFFRSGDGYGCRDGFCCNVDVDSDGLAVTLCSVK